MYVHTYIYIHMYIYTYICACAWNAPGMKAKSFTVCNLQTVASHKQEAIKPKVLLKQNLKDLNQIYKVPMRAHCNKSVLALIRSLILKGCKTPTTIQILQ